MLLHELNEQYIRLHSAKEEAFWAEKMGLKESVPGDFEAKEIQLQAFITDAAMLPKLRAELERSDLTPEERTGLEGWVRFFQANAIESAEAKALAAKIVEMEGELNRVRGGMELGYTDPDTGQFIAANSLQLNLLVQTSPNEAKRRAAWEGLRSIEPFVLSHGFIEVVKERNRLARMLGYEDYYDYKVTLNEGFSKRKLFELLDELERDTRDACQRSIDGLAEQAGAAAFQGWNFDYLTSGDLTSAVDPYHRFGDALNRWGRSFAAMGVRYGGATMQLDLVSRPTKHDNGFMHGPFPCYVDRGTFLPARINFTANAVPGQTGSGERAMNTLLHEGGHAAHFANITMPAPCFSQEFTPTSVAYAETQSMFMDSLMEDPDWMSRYAHDADGNPMPRTLMMELLAKNHRFRAFQIRRIMVVSYGERAIYEMPEAELTPANIVSALRQAERQILLLNDSPRPILSVPHLLAGEASAYYHGYVLAEMAVAQTRDFFLRRDGHLLDNPNIGPDLAKGYWNPGNSRSFLDLVHQMTGEPFSARAIVVQVNRSMEEATAEAERMIAAEPSIPKHTGAIDLDATISIVHGDTLVASTQREGSFEAMSQKFAEWIHHAETATN